MRAAGAPAATDRGPRTRRARRALALMPALFAGCAYFNGIYNAREFEDKADRLIRQGDEASARGAYLTAAAKAETVLVRYRKSRWRPAALYLAGRGAALGGDCPNGMRRLEEYFALPVRDAREQALAQVAYGVCEVQLGRLTDGRARLDALAKHHEREVARAAALWAARAAIRLGDPDAALASLGRVDAAAAQWELAMASLETGAWVRAESLLALRAIRGDFRDEVIRGIEQLWAAGETDAVERLVAQYDRGGSINARVRLHLHAGELALGSGRDSLAQRHLATARRLAVDPTFRGESAVRLMLARMAEADSLAAVERIYAEARAAAGTTPIYRRFGDNLLLMQLLLGWRDDNGVGQFLAAEVVRDSLRATRVAHRMLKAIADDTTRQASPVVPMALLAAAAIRPESAETYHARIRARHPGTPAALQLDGGDPAQSAHWRLLDQQFRTAWTQVTRQYRDTLVKVRRAGEPGEGATGPLP